MSEHTKEPWESYVADWDGRECVAIGQKGLLEEKSSRLIAIITETATMDDSDVANARRIVACVNACAGIPDIVLKETAECAEAGRFGTMAAMYKAERDKWERKAEQLRRVLGKIKQAVQSVPEMNHTRFDSLGIEVNAALREFEVDGIKTTDLGPEARRADRTIAQGGGGMSKEDMKWHDASIRHEALQEAAKRLDSEELMELLACDEHDRWVGQAHTALYEMTDERRERWARLVKTPYAELTEDMKELDRMQVRERLAIIRAAIIGTDAEK